MPEMDKGELTVSGAGETTIALDRRPERVKCHFKHPHHHHPPCDPDDDQLRFDVREMPRSRRDRRPPRWELMIWWSVSGVAEIEWHVEY